MFKTNPNVFACTSPKYPWVCFKHCYIHARAFLIIQILTKSEPIGHITA